MDRNPGTLRSNDSPSRVLPIDKVIGGEKKNATNLGGSILLDKDERELVKKGEGVTKEEMWELLENKRFEKLKDSAVNLQGDLIFNNRCPKCTLMPPCKHYESQDELNSDASNYILSSNFKHHLSPKKRQGLMQAVREQSTQYLRNQQQYDQFEGSG